MADLDFVASVGSATSDHSLFVAGRPFETDQVILDEATATYDPAIGDVLCYDTADTNKHQKYDADTATHVILGVISDVQVDEADTPVTILTFATRCTVYFESLGTTGVVTDAEYLALQNALRAKNIQAVQATDAS